LGPLLARIAADPMKRRAAAAGNATAAAFMV
jgi:hypothetical protein